jgi:ADP-heptose:LPS heptosyltransferase
MSEYHNILLVQLGDIGDVVLTGPTVRAIKETCPNARVSLLVRKPFGGLFCADPHLHEVVESAQVRGLSFYTLRTLLLLVRRLRRARYDLVIDLRTGDRGAVLTRLTGAAERIGRHEDNKPFWYQHLFTRLLADLPPTPLRAHPGAWQSLRVARAIGFEYTDTFPKLYPTPQDASRAAVLLATCGLTSATRWVSINPCSRWKYKEWGYEKWTEVIDSLWLHHNLPAVLVGSSEEAAAAEEIIAGRNERAFNLAGKTTLGELAALLSMSALHLGVDSAAPHMAAATGTPTLTLFGPGDWRGWTVADELHRVAVAPLPCVPCNKKGCDDTEKSRCLDELSAGRVCEEADLILSAIARNHDY